MLRRQVAEHHGGLAGRRCIRVPSRPLDDADWLTCWRLTEFAPDQSRTYSSIFLSLTCQRSSPHLLPAAQLRRARSDSLHGVRSLAACRRRAFGHRPRSLWIRVAHSCAQPERACSTLVL
eukprot:6184683-Pleurochrysis_carterae.AAC.1